MLFRSFSSFASALRNFKKAGEAAGGSGAEVELPEGVLAPAEELASGAAALMGACADRAGDSLPECVTGWPAWKKAIPAARKMRAKRIKANRFMAS